MAEADDAGSRRGSVLDPTDRFSEVVFGVVMAMTFTGTVSVAKEGEQDIRGRRRCRQRSAPRVARGDIAGALGVFSLVVLATLPVTLPFVFLSDVALAMRVSQGIGLTMLFLNGSALGHYAGFGTWRSGFTMLAIGVALLGRLRRLRQPVIRD